MTSGSDFDEIFINMLLARRSQLRLRERKHSQIVQKTMI